MRSTGKKKFPWGWLLIGVVVGAAIYWGPGLFHKGGDTNAAQGAGTPANVATVISKDITPFTEFSGRIEAVSSAEIRPQVSGQIKEVLFKDGSEVKKGQPLFTIDPAPYEAEVIRAKGSVVSAQSSSVNAEQQFKRAKSLYKAKAISNAEFDLATSNEAQAEGAIQTAQGALKAAEVNLAYAHIVAPITGKISRAEITEGNLVEAGGNAPLLASIVKLSPIYASFELDEHTFLSTIQGVPGSKLKQIPVEVGMANTEGTPIKATINSFDNQIAPGSGTIRVRAVIDNKDGALVPGLFARVRIGTPDPIHAILINPAAVGTDQNKKFVFVVNGEGKAEYREVQLGGTSDGLQIITSGLKDGEQIVISGLQRLRPGAPVKSIPSDMNTLKPLDAPADADAKPADAAAPADAKPAEDKPAETKPADDKPAEAK